MPPAQRGDLQQPQDQRHECQREEFGPVQDRRAEEGARGEQEPPALRHFKANHDVARRGVEFDDRGRDARRRRRRLLEIHRCPVFAGQDGQFHDATVQRDLVGFAVDCDRAQAGVRGQAEAVGAAARAAVVDIQRGPPQGAADRGLGAHPVEGQRTSFHGFGTRDVQDQRLARAGMELGPALRSSLAHIALGHTFEVHLPHVPDPHAPNLLPRRIDACLERDGLRAR